MRLVRAPSAAGMGPAHGRKNVNEVKKHGKYNLNEPGCYMMTQSHTHDRHMVLDDGTKLHTSIFVR